MKIDPNKFEKLLNQLTRFLEFDPDRREKMLSQHEQSIEFIYDEITLLRVIHDGKFLEYRQQTQLSNCITDLPFTIKSQNRKPVPSLSIIQFVRSLGFSGVTHIQVFTKNYFSAFQSQITLTL